MMLKTRTTFKFMCHIHSPALINTHMGVARLSTLGRQEKNISSSFPHPVIRGVRVPLFSWFPCFWIFSCAKISAFSFLISLFLAVLPSFTQFFVVFLSLSHPRVIFSLIFPHFSSFSSFNLILRVRPPRKALALYATEHPPAMFDIQKLDIAKRYSLLY